MGIFNSLLKLKYGLLLKSKGFQKIQENIRNMQNFGHLKLFGGNFDEVNLQFPLSCKEVYENLLRDMREKFEEAHEKNRVDFEVLMYKKKALEDNWETRYKINGLTLSSPLSDYINAKKNWKSSTDKMRMARKHWKYFQSLYDTTYFGDIYLSSWIQKNDISTFAGRRQWKKLCKKYSHGKN